MTKRLVPSLAWHPAVADPLAWAFRMEYAGADEVCVCVREGMPLATCHDLLKRLVRTLSIPLVVQPFATGAHFLEALLDLGVDRLLLPLDSLAAAAELGRRFGTVRTSVLVPASVFRISTTPLWAARDAGVAELVLEDHPSLPLVLEPLGIPFAVAVKADQQARSLGWLQEGADALYLQELSEEGTTSLQALKKGFLEAGLGLRI